MNFFAREIGRIPLMGGRVIGLEFVRAAHLSLGPFPIPLESQLYLWVLTNRSFSCRSLKMSSRAIILWGEVVCGEAEVAVDDGRVGQGVVGVEFDGPAEVADRFFDALARVTAPVITTFQLRLIGLCILRIARSNPLLFLTC